MPRESASRRRWIRVARVWSFLKRPTLWVVSALAVGSCACASRPPPQALAPIRDRLANLDEFGALLLRAGIPVEDVPEGRHLSPEQAEQFRRYLLVLPSVPQNYPPRFVADELLRYVEQQDKSVSLWDLSLKVQAYRDLFMLRPDGYLAGSLTGKPALSVGPVGIRGNRVGAGEFEVNVFYVHSADESWLRVDSPNADTNH